MNFIPQYEPLINKSYADAVNKQILSGWIGPSQTTLEFENKICEITGAKYCVSTTSGTTALMMAVIASKLKNHSKILFPAYTFLAGANAAKIMGHKIKLVDIKKETLSMNPDIDLNDVAAVIFVNHNAYIGEDIQKIKNKCVDRKIPMIEDSSQALGMSNAGRIGDMGIFSFSVPKIVTTGQGGAIITDNEVFYNRLIEIRDHGGDWRKSRLHKSLGVNFKFNDILASFGLEQLKSIDMLLEKRNKIFDCYRKHIKLVDFGYKSTWMVIYESKNSDMVINKLKNNNIQAIKYYKTINENTIYKNREKFPNANYVAKNFIYLPSSLGLTEKQINKICKTILSV